MIVGFTLFEVATHTEQMVVLRATLLKSVVPLLRQFLGGTDVRVTFGRSRDGKAPDCPMIHITKYPDSAAS